MIALDLFAGTGWGVACQRLGIEELGVELMPEAVASRDAAGMTTILRDVWTGLGRPTDQRWGYDLLIASPPCQTFSMAGGGAGRRALDEVLGLLNSGAYLHPHRLHDFGEQHDPRTALVLTPLAYAARDLPRFVVLEQVPPVLPVWEAMAVQLRANGYSVVTGILNAEQYGVPQTRRRAILIARRDGVEAVMPAPTHSRYHPRDPKRLDPGVLPWVSMAEALEGWAGGDLVGFARRADTPSNKSDGVVVLNGAGYRARDLRRAGEPAQHVTSKARSWSRYVAQKRMGAGMVERHGERPGRELDQPSFTIRASAGGMEPGGFRWAPVWADQSGTPVDPDWVRKRPSTTVASRDLVQNPGHTRSRHDTATKSRNDGVRVSLEQAAILQSYPADFPFQGTRTKRFLQLGNAVPPLLAEAILATLV